MNDDFIACCYGDCKIRAIFVISENTRHDVDNFTFSCMRHIGKMLSTTVGYPRCGSWTVTSIGYKTDEPRVEAWNI